MAKLTGPLHSIEAHKDLGKAIVYQRRPGGAAAYGYKRPKVPLTLKQLLQRERIRWCVNLWQSFSDAEKAEWEGKAQGRGQSGYSHFIKSVKGPILDLSLVLYLPLYDPRLVGDTFFSLDAYKQSITVTGALWTPEGRDFNGLTDKITVPAASLDNLLPYSQMVWAKFDAGYGELAPHLLAKYGAVQSAQYFIVHASSHYVMFAREFVDTDAAAKSANDFVPIGVWLCFGASLSAAKVPKIYYNGLEISNYATQTTGVGALTDDSGNDLIIGNNEITTRTIDGKIGEVFEYNRELSAAEFLFNYNATKWRYQ